MKSGLEDRNNEYLNGHWLTILAVSMKSGLEDRNNIAVPAASGVCARWSQ